MKLDPNDPRLTAYALGELDEQERATIDAQLTDNESARRTVDEIRQTAGVLTKELQAEECPEKSIDCRLAVEAQLLPTSEKPVLFPWRLLWATAGFAAAMIVVAIFLPVLKKASNTPQQLTASKEYAVDFEEAPRTEPPVHSSPSGTAVDELSVSDASHFTAKNLDSVGGVITPLNGLRGMDVGSSGDTDHKGVGGNIQFNDGHVEFKSKEAQVIRGTAEQPVPATPLPAPAGASQPYALGQLSRKKENTSAGWYSDDSSDLNRSGEATKRIKELSKLFKSGQPSRTSESGITFSEYEGERPPTPESYPGTESYQPYAANQFTSVGKDPLSTFSLDVDTASYANIRRFLERNTLPPRDAVRIEEMLNYFNYDYPEPKGDKPFAAYIEISECPWNPDHRLARIGIKAKEIAAHKRPASNLVFLIDVSGSMEPANKLPLIKRAFHLLVDQLDERDRVAIVVYAGNARIVLQSTPASEKRRILAAIDSLEASGSTNGGEGIQSAYDQATQNFIEGGVNRVILCSDGDFNVGITSQDELTRLIKQKAKSGTFLSVLGFGMGNLKDSTMEKLADNGNGHYAYIDTLDEARKMFVEQLTGTLVTVAKDAKIQLEFNPVEVSAYRLIGYEKRMLRAQDFNDDRKDAGDVGAGHTITALYEIVPADADTRVPPAVDPLRYQKSFATTPATFSGELFLLKIRYKDPDATDSKLASFPVKDRGERFGRSSEDFKFACAVAEFGMLLRGASPGERLSYERVLEIADEARSHDSNGYRAELIGLVKKAKSLSNAD